MSYPTPTTTEFTSRIRAWASSTVPADLDSLSAPDVPAPIQEEQEEEELIHWAPEECNAPVWVPEKEEHLKIIAGIKERRLQRHREIMRMKLGPNWEKPYGTEEEVKVAGPSKPTRKTSRLRTASPPNVGSSKTTPSANNNSNSTPNKSDKALDAFALFMKQDMARLDKEFAARQDRATDPRGDNFLSDEDEAPLPGPPTGSKRKRALSKYFVTEPPVDEDEDEDEEARLDREWAEGFFDPTTAPPRPNKKARTEGKKTKTKAKQPLPPRTGMRSQGRVPEITTNPVHVIRRLKRTRQQVEDEEADADVSVATPSVDDDDDTSQSPRAPKRQRSEEPEADDEAEEEDDEKTISSDFGGARSSRAPSPVPEEDPEAHLPRPPCVTDLPDGHPARIHFEHPIHRPTPSAWRPAPSRSALKSSTATPASSNSPNPTTAPKKTVQIYVTAEYSQSKNEFNFSTWRNDKKEKAIAMAAYRAEQRELLGLPPLEPQAPKAHIPSTTPPAITPWFSPHSVIPPADTALDDKYVRYESAVLERWGIDLSSVRRQWTPKPPCPNKQRPILESIRSAKMMHSSYPPWTHPAWSAYSTEQILGWETSKMYSWTRRGWDGESAVGTHERDGLRLNVVFGEGWEGELEEEEEQVDTEVDEPKEEVVVVQRPVQVGGGGGLRKTETVAVMDHLLY